MTRHDIIWQQIGPKYKANINNVVLNLKNEVTSFFYEISDSIIYVRCKDNFDKKLLMIFNPAYIGTYPIISFEEIPFDISFYYHTKPKNPKYVKYIVKIDITEIHVVSVDGNVDKWLFTDNKWNIVNMKEKIESTTTDSNTKIISPDRQKIIVEIIKTKNQFLIDNLIQKDEIEALVTSGILTIEYKIINQKIRELPDAISNYYRIEHHKTPIHSWFKQDNGKITIMLTGSAEIRTWQNTENGWQMQ